MITHRFSSPVANDADPTKIQPSHWNDAHVLTLLAIDPISPAVGDLWMLANGATPNRTLELKFCDADGVVVTLFSVVR